MLQFPPLPTWDSLHPLIIHFPIVLLLLSPLFILVSTVLSPQKGRPYMFVAVFLLLLGTGSLFFAALTGEAAADLAERGGEMNAVLEAHENLASETKIIFSVLSAILLGMVVMFRLLRRQETKLALRFLPLTFLALYTVGVLFLVNTAHAGGRLVHEFGVHAMIPGTSDKPGVSTAVEGSAESMDKD